MQQSIVQISGQFLTELAEEGISSILYLLAQAKKLSNCLRNELLHKQKKQTKLYLKVLNQNILDKLTNTKISDIPDNRFVNCHC